MLLCLRTPCATTSRILLWIPVTHRLPATQPGMCQSDSTAGNPKTTHEFVTAYCCTSIFGAVLEKTSEKIEMQEQRKQISVSFECRTSVASQQVSGAVSDPWASLDPSNSYFLRYDWSVVKRVSKRPVAARQSLFRLPMGKPRVQGILNPSINLTPCDKGLRTAPQCPYREYRLLVIVVGARLNPRRALITAEVPDQPTFYSVLGAHALQNTTRKCLFQWIEVSLEFSNTMVAYRRG